MAQCLHVKVVKRENSAETPQFCVLENAAMMKTGCVFMVMVMKTLQSPHS